MIRCHVEPEQWQGDEFALPQGEAHHLAHVLRARVGDIVTLFDGLGTSAQAAILAIARDRVMVRLAPATRQTEAPARVRVTLMQAVTKPQSFEWILQKAGELGASAIIPVLSERVVWRADRANAVAKRERWRAIAIGAARQCGANRIPDLAPATSLAALLPTLGQYELCILGALRPDARPMRELLAETRDAMPKSIALLVGPEGDFTPAELDAAIAANARPVSFGPCVLRSETAALFGLSALLYEFGSGHPPALE